MEGTVRHPLEWTRALVLEFRTSLAGDLVRRQVRIMGRKAYCFARSSPLRAQAGFGVTSLHRNGAPRPMKVGNVVSLWRYDAGAYHALESLIP
jgi:hypothetical protein